MFFNHLLEEAGSLDLRQGPPSTLHDAVEALAKEEELISVAFSAADASVEAAAAGKAEGELQQQQQQKPQQERQQAQLNRETRDLLLLQRVLPKLLQRGMLLEAERALLLFLDRHPRNADGFALLAEVYVQQQKPTAVCESLWGSIYNSPGNRKLLRELRAFEESCFLQQCALPLPYLLKALAGPTPRQQQQVRLSASDPLAAVFAAEGSPVVVARQGKQVSLMTSKPLQPGDVVFREKPFVVTPLLLEQGQIQSSCFHCMQERADSSRCFSCPVAPHTCPLVFCSWRCLMLHSRIHVLECQALPLLLAAAREASLSPATVLHAFRAIAKVGLERQFKHSGEAAQAEADVVDQLLQLNSYREAARRGQPKVYRQFTILARRLQRELPATFLLFLSEEDLMDLLLVLWQYSPLLSAPSVASAAEARNPAGTTGHVLATAVALLPHSCVPTCCLSLDADGLVSVRALVRLPAGGRLCVCLEDDFFKPQRDRKEESNLPRVFGCGCVRCTDSLEGGRQLRGIRCFSCIRGFLNPSKSRALAARLWPYSDPTSLLPAAARAAPPAKLQQMVPFEKFTKQNERTNAGFLSRQAKQAEGPALADETLTDEEAEDRQEKWLCCYCELASPEVSRRCSQLETEVETQQRAAEKALVSGGTLKARKEYTTLVLRFGSQLHPQHAVLFNAHVILAGLLAKQPAKDPLQALIYGRRAALAADSVSPPSSRLKVDLYVKIADWTYQAMQLDQHCRRGPLPPADTLLGPMYAAVWHCFVCYGGKSSLTVILQQKLRRYAARFGLHTPPLLQRPLLRTTDVFAACYRETTGATDSTQAIAQQFAKDPLSLAVVLVRRGVCRPFALELFYSLKDVQHFPTGLTLLGLACANKQLPVVKHFLSFACCSENLSSDCLLSADGEEQEEEKEDLESGEEQEDEQEKEEDEGDEEEE
ncbi:hypothetical protein Efla_005820 [Eimeria flavescens]